MLVLGASVSGILLKTEINRYLLFNRMNTIKMKAMSLHTGQFPAYRPRRLRQSAVLRQLVREARLHASQLVLPLFVRPGRKLRRPITAMPGVFQLSTDELVREAGKAHEKGVQTILLFGIPDKK